MSYLVLVPCREAQFCYWRWLFLFFRMGVVSPWNVERSIFSLEEMIRSRVLLRLAIEHKIDIAKTKETLA